jgi:transcriptional regulator with XRE-family HTH domain
MTNLQQLLASNIKTYRAALDISQAKLAEKVDTASNYIALIEMGKRFPSAPMLERIASALEVDSPELFVVRPTEKDAIRQVHEKLLVDIEQMIAERFRELE